MPSEPRGTMRGNVQFEEDKQKGSNKAAKDGNTRLQDQRLSTLLDCSSLNWSSSDMPISLLIAQVSGAAEDATACSSYL